ncbi:testosterone 17-beta-dehydrogenase 3 [Cyanistes caeruleus]|uniref:testosterone 17-beta-dehydrogenase 3 n=1 Tax=Cyanistes caeruleus TaxID=156563 RepID=UPI000CDA3E32|nr:testosterone 17-beta-dehydrogenase 3 [Cyanistes caeruleus]
MEVFQHQLLSLVGGLICFCTLVKCIRFMKNLFHIYGVLYLRLSFGQWEGEWSVVTGAGDGIEKHMPTGKIDNPESLSEYLVSTSLRIHSVFMSSYLPNQRIIGKLLPSNCHLRKDLLFCCFQQDLVNCNIISITKVILKQMQPSQKGLILNLPSDLSTFLFPLCTMYPATKANLSRCLMKNSPLSVYQSIVSVAIPYGVAEEFVSESLEYITFGDKIFGMSHP